MACQSIAIVTGSCAQIPKHKQEKLRIKVLPFTIHLNGNSYLDDGAALTPSQIYRVMRSSNMVPTTAPPSNGDYLRTFQSLFEEGCQDVIYLSISQKLSSDYHAACGAADLVNSNYPGNKVHVVDSASAAIPQGFLAMEAAEKALQGMSARSIVQWLEGSKIRAGLVASLDTLEYLARGGRIGKASRFIGSMLDIKPLLSLIDGVVMPVAVQRGPKKVLSAILEAVKKAVAGWKRLYLAVLHADDRQRAEVLLQMVGEIFQVEDVYLCEITPMMGVHVGPGLIGLGYYFE
jgi:DegV family protein with EDD domain